MSETVSGDALSGIELSSAAPASVGAVGSQSYTTSIGVLNVSPNLIAFGYDTPPGNQPATYGNTVFLWQTASPALPPTTPLASARIAGNLPTGSGAIHAQVTQQGYLLGYATGPDTCNVCATAFIAPGGQVNQESPDITPASVTPTLVVFAYTLPAGVRPAACGHWVGLWQGASPNMLYQVPPLAFVPVQQDASSGDGVLQNVAIRRGAQYTLGYFAGGYAHARPSQTTLACSTTFTT